MSDKNKTTPLRILATLRATMLCTTIMAAPALAQPAPNAHPLGGAVSAGQATISQSASVTTINQSSARAAVNWQSFDVGTKQTVQFVQPSTSATTLNRVLSPDPSQIAGRITANGQIVIENQSGVVFAKGAQVDAASLVVSAPGITDQNFMAGKMTFDIPARPNAKIVNDGHITVKQSGLAALVAPQVANDGVITAKMGHVVLAGAATQTVDLYGDGMVAINVTGQVTQAPVGADGKTVTALVTNSGVVIASGGTVELTARAVDGIVQNLVTAGGHISVNTVGAHTGKIVVSGVGGSIIVDGDVSAAGLTPGTKGGVIGLNATGVVTVAAGAKVNASGAAGGGIIAIGTTLARARGGPSVTSKHTAAMATIAKGATISADAKQAGNGGTVVVLSTQTTSMAGRVTARGGPRGGNGGHVELSGDTGFALAGTVNVTAQTAKGLAGTILIDPRDLYIDSTNPYPSSTSSDTTLTAMTAASSPLVLPGAATDAWLTPASINTLSGAVTLTATRDLSVLSPLDTTASGITSLALTAGDDITVSAALTTAGNLTLVAGNELTSSAAMASTGGSVALTATGSSLEAGGLVSAGVGKTISIAAPSAYSFQALSAPSGTVEIGPSTADAAANFGIGVSSSGTAFTASTVRIGTTSQPGAPVTTNLTLGNDTFGPNVNNYGAATLSLAATGTVSEYPTSSIVAGGLAGSVGTLTLANAGNSFNTVGPLTATGNITLGNSAALTISGAVTTPGTLSLTNGSTVAIDAPLTANTISIAAPSSITLASNLVFVAQGSTPGTATFQLLTGGATSNFIQSGTSLISGISPNAVTIQATGPGNILLSNLVAPSTTLTVQTNGGETFTGQVSVGALNLAVTGSSGSAALNPATVGGLTGSLAAAATAINPVLTSYLVNGCIAGVGCAASLPTMTTTSMPAPVAATPVVATTPATTPGASPPAVPATATQTPLPSLTAEQVQAAAVVANNIAVTTPVVTGIANIVGAISTYSIAPDDPSAGSATASSGGGTETIGAEESGQPRTQQRGVPLVNPLGEMARAPLRNRAPDPDLVVPNVSERDY